MPVIGPTSVFTFDVLCVCVFAICRLAYRAEEWDPDFRAYLKSLDSKKPVVWCGDLNVSHLEIGSCSIYTLSPPPPLSLSLSFSLHLFFSLQPIPRLEFFVDAFFIQISQIQRETRRTLVSHKKSVMAFPTCWRRAFSTRSDTSTRTRQALTLSGLQWAALGQGMLDGEIIFLHSQSCINGSFLGEQILFQLGPDLPCCL